MASSSTIIAAALIIGGALVSITVVGAIVGIPMIILGLLIWVLDLYWATAKHLFGENEEG